MQRLVGKRSALKIAVIGAAVAYASLIVAGNLGRSVGALDESMQYVGAMLVRRGDRVNLDFHSVYPPLNYQLTSWAFALLGETALAARLLQVVLYLILLAFIWSLFRSEGFRGTRLWVMLLVAVALTSPLPGLAAFVGLTPAFVGIVFYLYAIGANSESRR